MSRLLVDSGISWLGKIPEDWTVAKVKNRFFHHKNVAKEDAINYDRVSLTLNGVILRDKEDANGLQPEDFYGYKIVKKNDIIFKLIDLENVNTSRVGRSDYEGITSPAYILLHEKDEVEPYFDFYFKNLYYQEIFNNLGGNGVRSAINKDDLLNIPLLIPTSKDIKRISNYLNNKCKKIDDIIKDNEKEIELLEEYSKNVFKDEISKHSTEVFKLKYLVSKKLQYGANSSGQEYNPDLPRYVRITDIINNGLKSDDILSLSEEEAKDFILNEGDILFARSGGTVGKSFLYKNNYGRCAFAGYLIRAQFDDLELSSYVYNYTNSVLYDEWKNSIFIQSTIQNIGADKYSVMPIPIPIDRNAIRLINKNVLDKTEKIDKVIEYRKRIIDKLEELKKSLIYEVITGKKEV